jgi:hypothetical protein
VRAGRAVRTLASTAAAAARLTRAVPRLLSQPISPADARAALGRRLAGRESSFLEVLRRGVYQHPSSPYRALLRRAGCEWGDLEALVRERGVEGALAALLRHGVYLTVDEFKGRHPVVRGATTLAASPSALRNPAAAAHVPFQSGGSRGVRTDVWLDAAFLRERAGNIGLVFRSRGDAAWEYGIWLVPGGAVIVHVLEFALFGTPHRHWFSQLDPGSPALPARYRWSERLVRGAALLAGVRLPRPRYVSLDDPLPIARWMAHALRAGGRPNLWTFASSAVRLCRAAEDAGVDIQGAQFSVGGEPFTEARQAIVRRVGAEAYPQYGIAECGEVAGACLAPRELDEMHLFHDLHALVQPGVDGPARGLAPDALLISSLSPTAPFVLLNVSMGDRATLRVRACGCPIERLGWTTHLHALRSNEKLTAAGMTFHDADVIRVLEEILPARFGGGPTDYQILEEEDAGGRSRLRLLVHPRVARFDAAAIADAFLAGLGAGPGAESLMALLWREAGVLAVERRAPVTAVSGKLLHLHSGPRPAPGAATGATA